MKAFDLEPRYSTNQISGKCLKCLAEQELNDCVMRLLGEELADEEVKQKFEMLVAFLKSPESQGLRDESEKYLAEGKRVTLRISFDQGQPRYELIVSE
jgi:hypothetical protein